MKPERAVRHALVAAALLAAAPVAADFRVTPYLQNPAPRAVTVTWFSDGPAPGRLELYGDAMGEARVESSEPVRAEALAYHPAEALLFRDGIDRPAPPPFRHELRLEGLSPGTSYRYRVVQGDAEAGGRFVTPPLPESRRPLRFVVFGDSETEPESVGKHAHWPEPGVTDSDRRYPVDQETGYRENLRLVRDRKPAFVAIAGDLVESGGEQRDWDAYWRLTAPLAADSFLLPALGNHDYFGGPVGFGNYAPPATARALSKYLVYFDLPENGTQAHDERYYALRWGPVTLVVLDLNNGLPQQGATDTNFYLLGEGEGGTAPDWQPGSTQYAWLERTLQAAQRRPGFTFVLAHHCPYSSGPHGLPAGRGEGLDPLSGVPLRALSPLFLRYGVDALFTGHDEMYERSVVPGLEQRPDGTERAHRLQVYDVGVAGDGLRAPVAGTDNPNRAFLAHSDAPEERGPDGVLLRGGKHYGHLEVNVEPLGETGWRALLDMVQSFPVTDREGRVLRFERRLYDDRVELLDDEPGAAE